MHLLFVNRDQIHKLACNHLLTEDMSLKPMSTSTTAWTWVAMDYSQGELIKESFAVRFKTEEQATLFKAKIEESQTALKKGTPAAALKSTPVHSIGPSNSFTTPVPASETSNNEEEEGEHGEEEEEDQDEEEYEDVEESIMFEKRCTLSYLEGGADKSWMLLGTGTLKIVYDDEMLCARIVVEDGNEAVLCDNVIAIETQLKVLIL